MRISAFNPRFATCLLATAVLACLILGATGCAADTPTPDAAASDNGPTMGGPRISMDGTEWPGNQIVRGAAKTDLQEARKNGKSALRLPADDVLSSGDIATIVELPNDTQLMGYGIFFTDPHVEIAVEPTDFPLDLEAALAETSQLDQRTPEKEVRLRRRVMIAGIEGYAHEAGTITWKDGTSDEFPALVSWQVSSGEPGAEHVLYTVRGWGLPLVQCQAIAESMMREK